MGYIIRICLTQPNLQDSVKSYFLLVTTVTFNMYPMIISVDEVHEIKAIVAEVKKELDEQVPYGNVEQGIMIETPAAVL